MDVLEDRDLYRCFAFIVVLAFSANCLIAPLLNPVDNWDMLGYAASVKTLYGLEASAIHTQVFAEYKAYATPYHFDQLTNANSYREVMYQDAAAFYQQIPYYKIRVLYVLLLATASELGANIFATMHFLSSFFAAAAFLVLYLGLRKRIHSVVWLIAPFFFYYYSLEFKIFQKGGVDTFAFFWVSMMVVAFLHRSKVLYPLIAFSVLVRTDLILYDALIFAAALYWYRSDWRHIFFWGVMTMIAYFWVNSWSGNLGWTTLINFVFVSKMLATHPDQYSQNAIEITQYLGFIFSKYDWISPWFWVSISISILNLALVLTSFKVDWTKQNLPKSQVQLLWHLHTVSVISLLYIIAHYLLFPAVFMRFFYGHSFLSALTILATIGLFIENFSRQRNLSAAGDNNTNDYYCRQEYLGKTST